jgi:predicted transcriptional regulator
MKKGGRSMPGKNLKSGESTKLEQLLAYIEGLEVGTKISVRQMAKEHGVSEGTAYRAIKEAEQLGLISTKERIGSVRIARRQRGGPEQLTYGEVLEIVQGSLLGGEEGLEKTLHKFVIGAMELDEMTGYIDAGSLLIVGNREGAHRIALEHGAGVLVTGGFVTSEDVRALADARKLPIMTCKHDTYTVASMINRAIFDRQIKRKIMMIADLVEPSSRPGALKQSATVADFHRLSKETGGTRFPVTDEWNRVVGMITAKDVAGSAPSQTLDKLMTRRPMTVSMTTPIASAAHRMLSEGLEVLPVTDRQRKLIGTVGRAEVLRAMHFERGQSHLGETFDALMWSGLTERRDDEGRLYFTGSVTPQMSGPLGTVSEGVLAALMQQAGARAAEDLRRRELVLENMTAYFLRTIPIDAVITIQPSIIEASRRFVKMEVQVLHDGEWAAKALMTIQTMDPA